METFIKNFWNLLGMGMVMEIEIRVAISQKIIAYWNKKQLGENLARYPSADKGYFFFLCTWQMLNWNFNWKF